MIKAGPGQKKKTPALQRDAEFKELGAEILTADEECSCKVLIYRTFDLIFFLMVFVLINKKDSEIMGIKMKNKNVRWASSWEVQSKSAVMFLASNS